MDAGFTQGFNRLPSTRAAKQTTPDEIRTIALIYSLFNKWKTPRSKLRGMRVLTTSARNELK